MTRTTAADAAPAAGALVDRDAAAAEPADGVLLSTEASTRPCCRCRCLLEAGHWRPPPKSSPQEQEEEEEEEEEKAAATC